MNKKPNGSRQRELRNRRFTVVGLIIVLAIYVGSMILVQRSRSMAFGAVPLQAITALSITLILVMLFVLGRNVIKLYVERRRQKLGSQFSTRVVVTYIGMALIPTVMLFIAASGLIRSAVDNWFSPVTEQIVRSAREVSEQAQEDLGRELQRVATAIADEMSEDRVTRRDPPKWELLRLQYLEPWSAQFELDAVVAYEGTELLLDPVFEADGPYADLFSRPASPASLASTDVDAGDGVPVFQPLPEGHPLFVPAAEIALALQGTPFRLNDPLSDETRLLRAGVPILDPNDADLVTGVLVVGRVVDRDLTGLYLARGVTGPIQKLAEGTRAVASGDLSYQVEVEARDELGTLVESFNQMTLDLRAGRENLRTSRDSLQATNTELDERRRYMEAVLANIATGVVSLNAEGEITTFNRAAERMLAMEAHDAIGQRFENALNDEPFADLKELMQRAKARRAPLEDELSLDVNGSRLTIAAHCSSLRDSAGAYMGTVVVLDDLTELITAQKTAAWREVARRIAHEIRNPLTPIQLSAQRIARRYRRAVGAEGQFDVIEEGTRTILQEVNTLEGLVSEFSRYARMPTVSLVPANLHDIVENGLLACASMHDGITVERYLSPQIPTIKADPEQLKRAFTNLFDNAVEAMEGDGTLRVATSYDTEIRTVRIEIADTGPGITPEDKDRLFLPYFSRKRDGTGLGLAIVHQIVADHSGYVKVSDNQPHGTVFTVELPC